MATPASGAISMDNMRDEITRSTGSVSMSEIRTRYGGSGAISFSDLYASEGWVQTNGTYTSKFFNATGWYYTFSMGSISPAESGNRLLITTTPSPGTSVIGFYTTAGGGFLQLANSSYTGTIVASGWRAQDVTRMVAANVARAGSASSNTVFDLTSYQPAGSGTIHCMVKF